MQFRGTTCLHTKYWNKLYHCNYVNCSPILAIAFVLKSTKKIYALWWERISWIFPGCLQEREVFQKPVFGEIKLFTSAASLSCETHSQLQQSSRNCSANELLHDPLCYCWNLSYISLLLISQHVKIPYLLHSLQYSHCHYLR